MFKKIRIMIEKIQKLEETIRRMRKNIEYLESEVFKLRFPTGKIEMEFEASVLFLNKLYYFTRDGIEKIYLPRIFIEHPEFEYDNITKILTLLHDECQDEYIISEGKAVLIPK